MNKTKYSELEECFEKLLNDYNAAQTEIKELKENIEFLKHICRVNNISVADSKEPNPF